MKAESRPHAVIEIMEDGPFIVKGLENFYDSKGEELDAGDTVALCRCGFSSNKPFCDGTHKKKGFSGKRETEKPIDREKQYEGKEVTVRDNRLICSHAAECVNNLPSVFRPNERPWIVPDNAGAEEVVEVIKKCPSGALSYKLDGVLHRDFGHKPGITVTKDGPYAVTGGLILKIEEELQPPSKEHYVLCRCGASKNKPYCDGSHKDIGFTDE